MAIAVPRQRADAIARLHTQTRQRAGETARADMRGAIGVAVDRSFDGTRHDRPKTGFDIPAHEWLRGPLLPLLTDALHFGASEYGDFFRSDVVQRFLRLHLGRKANVGYHGVC